MKTILDRFDRSPLWLRLATIFILTGVLVGGLYTVRKNSADQVTVVKQETKKTGSLPIKKKDPKKAKEEEEAKIAEAAEKAVAHIETTATQETLTAAQEAVEKVKDETKKQAFQARIQYIVDYYGMQTNQSAQTNQTPQATDANQAVQGGQANTATQQVVPAEVPQYQSNEVPQVSNATTPAVTQQTEQ